MPRFGQESTRRPPMVCVRAYMAVCLLSWSGDARLRTSTATVGHLSLAVESDSGRRDRSVGGFFETFFVSAGQGTKNSFPVTPQSPCRRSAAARRRCLDAGEGSARKLSAALSNSSPGVDRSPASTRIGPMRDAAATGS